MLPEMKKCHFFAWLLSGVLLCGAALSDDSLPDFRQAIQQIAEGRSEIDSYDVTVSGKVRSHIERVKRTDGSVYEIKDIPTSAKGTPKMTANRLEGVAATRTSPPLVRPFRLTIVRPPWAGRGAEAKGTHERRKKWQIKLDSNTAS